MWPLGTGLGEAGGGGGGGGGGGEQQHYFGYAFWEPPPLPGFVPALGQAIGGGDSSNVETPAARVTRLRAELAEAEEGAAAEEGDAPGTNTVKIEAIKICGKEPRYD